MFDVITPPAFKPAAPRKLKVWENAEGQARTRRRWREKASFFHAEDNAYLRFLIPPGLQVLEIGCGTGETLAALRPSRGIGIDFSPAMIAEAVKAHPHLEFFVGDAEDPVALVGLSGPFDVILIVDTLGFVEDVQ